MPKSSRITASTRAWRSAAGRRAPALLLLLAAATASAERREAADPEGGTPAPAPEASGTPVPAPPPNDGPAPPPESSGTAASPPSRAAPPATAEPSRDYSTTVTGTRLPRPQRDTPVAVTVLPRDEIDRSPTLTTDNLLRSVPSVATFRRTTSVVSDPTAQGLNLRGIGPSGVSRTLVLSDGIPLNDPFGGWIYWRALPRLGMDRIEIAPGGASASYGNHALGGVVQTLSRPVLRSGVEADVAGGSFGTGMGALRVTHRSSAIAAAIEGELLSSGGWHVLQPSARGAVDQTAWSQHATIDARVEATPRERLRLIFGGTLFGEDQNGGTRFTAAQVRVGTWRARSELRLERAGRLDLSLFGGFGLFEQDRARILNQRSVEQQLAAQRVPSDHQGASVVWGLPAVRVAGTHRLAVGADVRRVAGVSTERTLSPDGAVVSTRRSGGQQQFLGVFAENAWSPIRALEVTGALRFDVWRNLHGKSTLNGAGDPIDDRTATQLSPRLGALARLTDALALRASAYRAFRAPTLNELYRPFQVGTIFTDANAALEAEDLIGGEAGPEISLAPSAVLRVTGFWNVLRRPVGNVTLADPPDGSRRQRQNLGEARIRGVEASAQWSPAPRWTALAGYTWADSRVTSAPAVRDLEGNRLAQDPVHRATAGVAFDDRRLLGVTLQARYIGSQFEDDQNELRMPGFLLVDALVSRRVWSGLEAYAAVENLLDKEYLVGRAGLDTWGQPRTIRVGLRLRDLRGR